MRWALRAETHRKLQFGIVREDPRLELEVLPPHARRTLLIASAGCTALTLWTHRPDIAVDLVDSNPAQLELTRRKVEAMSRLARPERLRAFGVGAPESDRLTQGGQFESLFRCLRRFIEEFVVSAETLRAAFDSFDALTALRLQMLAHPYWPVAFDLHFSSPLLDTMFGPDATQHAAPGSYPRYFQRVFEDELRRPRALENPFLHHVLFGEYRESSLPDYLRVEPPAEAPRFEFFEGAIMEVEDFAPYDVVHLSNIFDWMSVEAARPLAERLARELRPGARFVLRQLNNPRDYEPLFGEAFGYDRELAARWVDCDRSLFYERILVGTRR